MTPRALPQCLSLDLGRADQDCITAASTDVLAWLKACAALGDLPKTDRRPDGSAIDAWFLESAWLARAAVAYARSGRDAAVTDWLLRQANTLAAMLDRQLTVLWPKRAAGDYSAPTQLPVVAALYYNNRRAMQAMCVAIIGATFGEFPLKATATRYFQEWVRFGVDASGAQSDWGRATDKVPAQGLIYGAVNIACALETAMRLDTVQERSLIDFEADRKTIWTAFDRHVAILRGETVRLPSGEPIDPWNGPAGRMMQWSYYLPAAKRYGRAQYLVTLPLGDGDYYWAPRTGVAGVRAAL